MCFSSEHRSYRLADALKRVSLVFAQQKSLGIGIVSSVERNSQSWYIWLAGFAVRCGVLVDEVVYNGFRLIVILLGCEAYLFWIQKCIPSSPLHLNHQFAFRCYLYFCEIQTANLSLYSCFAVKSLPDWRVPLGCN